MRFAKCLVLGVACLGLTSVPLGCGSGEPEEVTAEDDYGTSEEGMEEMEDVADVDGLEDVSE